MADMEKGSGEEIASLLVTLTNEVRELQRLVSAQGINEQQMRDLTSDVEEIRKLLEAKR